MPAGRPSTFDEEIFTQIIERVSDGEPLAQICRSEGFPGLRTVYDWAQANVEISARIARAREVGEDVIAAGCLEIADDARNDWMERMGKEGDATGWQFNAEHVQRSKLRIETRLKLLAKWNPKKYGEKVDVQVTNQPIVKFKDALDEPSS